jgi:hypothetical protein
MVPTKRRTWSSVQVPSRAHTQTSTGPRQPHRQPRRWTASHRHGPGGRPPRAGWTPARPTPRHERPPARLLILVSWVRIPAGSPPSPSWIGLREALPGARGGLFDSPRDGHVESMWWTLWQQVDRDRGTPTLGFRTTMVERSGSPWCPCRWSTARSWWMAASTPAACRGGCCGTHDSDARRPVSSVWAA